MDTDKILNSMNIHEQNGLLKSCQGTICDGLFHLYYQWRTTIDSKNIAESDAIAQCILQIVICKIRTLLVMCEGINVRPGKDTIRILDIPSMLSVLRSLYEMAFVFHNIYAEQETEEERNIVLYLWEIRGLNNRQNLSIVPLSFKRKEEDEKKQIEDLIRDIERIAVNLNLSDELKGQLTKVMTSKSVDIKGYQFKKDCPHFSPIQIVRAAVGFSRIFAEVKEKHHAAMRREMAGYLGGGGTFYRYRNGERLLMPEQQEWIKKMFLRYGYTEEVVFDNYKDVYRFDD